MLTSFVRFLAGRDVLKATPADVEAFLSRPRPKRNGADPSPSTASLELTVLRGFYSWLIDRHGMTSNPAKLALEGGCPKIVVRNPDPIPDEAWTRFMRHWPELPEDARCALSLGFFGGLRRKEITGLHSDQWAEPDFRILGIERKGGASQSLPFGDCLHQVHEELPHLLPKAGPEDILETLDSTSKRRKGLLLLPWQVTPHGVIDPQTLNRRVRAWLSQADMPGAFHPHQMRHSFVTNLLRAGVPIDIVSDLAGHSDINMTMRYAKSGNHRFPSWRKSRLS
jgi:integrase